MSVDIITDVRPAAEAVSDYTGIPVEELIEKFQGWVDRGDRVIVFRNEDMGHPRLGEIIAYPWTSEGEIPRHAPDHRVYGFGWRYLPFIVVEPSTN